jgi:hypothetical protein
MLLWEENKKEIKKKGKKERRKRKGTWKGDG